MSDNSSIIRIGVIILAAGASRRMGKPKQLIGFHGKPLLQTIIDRSQAYIFDTYVLVLGAHSDEIQKAIDPGRFRVIINEDWKEGMAGSIRKGVEGSLGIKQELEHILILLSDQPFVSSELICEMIERHRQHGKAITACKYQDTVGVPAIFTRPLFRELCLLDGDRGARVLIKRYSDNLVVVPFELGSIDLDKPEDYRKLLDFNEH